MGDCSTNCNPCGPSYDAINQLAVQTKSYARQALSAVTTVEEFQSLYLGAKATAPTTDNEGNPLQVGALYFNTTDGEIYVWAGSAWEFFGQSGFYLGPKASDPTTDNEGGPLVAGLLYFNTVSNTMRVYNGTFWQNVSFDESTPFIATGTTEPRNLVTRFADVVNVKDFGAVGDGVTDDWAAIQAAINTGNRIIFPKPDVAYYIETTITVPQNRSLIGEGAERDSTTILSARGMPAIWVQGSFVDIEGINISFKKEDIDDFTNTNDVGIRVRDVGATLPTHPSNWPYLSQINIQNVRIQKAYTSIDMDAVFWVSIEDCNLYRDFNSVRINRNATNDRNGIGDPIRIATTVKIDRVYCHGTGTAYPIPSQSKSFDIQSVQVLEMSHCVSENVHIIGTIGTISAGTLRHFYAENFNVGFSVFGALSPFIVEQPFIYKGIGLADYCFRVSAGNMTFIGGLVTMNGGTDSFYSQDPLSPTASATFLKLPVLVNCMTYTTTSTKLIGGLDSNGDIVLGTNDGNYKTLISQDVLGAFTSGVPKVLDVSHRQAGLYLVYGYSATGNGTWLVMARSDDNVTVISDDNTTGGTVTFNVDNQKRLTITSIGSSSQVLLDAQIISLMR